VDSGVLDQSSIIRFIEGNCSACSSQSRSQLLNRSPSLFPRIEARSPLDGRLLLLLSPDSDQEPRMQVDDTPRSQIVFRLTVDRWRAGQAAVVDADASGYAIHSLRDVRAGEYIVQAVLNKYEQQKIEGTLQEPTSTRFRWQCLPGFYSASRVAVLTLPDPTTFIDSRLECRTRGRSVWKYFL
jgi:hypothetical protein